MISELTKEQLFDLIHAFKDSKRRILISYSKVLVKSTDRQTIQQSRAMPQLCMASQRTST
jgi:hypothetical protein